MYTISKLWSRSFELFRKNVYTFCIFSSHPRLKISKQISNFISILVHHLSSLRSLHDIIENFPTHKEVKKVKLFHMFVYEFKVLSFSRKTQTLQHSKFLLEVYAILPSNPWIDACFRESFLFLSHYKDTENKLIERSGLHASMILNISLNS